MDFDEKYIFVKTVVTLEKCVFSFTEKIQKKV